MSLKKQLVGSRRRRLTLLLLLLGTTGLQAGETVVLLHGLARSANSMDRLEAALAGAGYGVLNIDYPSTEYPLETLALQVHETVVEKTAGADRIHFVTHSMGGILVRYMEAHWPLPNLGRVVMLSPPNQGSEVVDKLGDNTFFQKFNGPAGQQLGTDPEDSIPLQLGPVDFELGVITGDRSINWILSTLIPGPDDGKVSVDKARIEGMKAFKVVHATHPLIMNSKSVIADVLSFLKTGNFTN